ncbi:MAG: hypothetical protein H0W99_15690 [Acidobacteria bacterium]|nr:hypothetical protein [Acidobacteriota bacterium]
MDYTLLSEMRQLYELRIKAAGLDALKLEQIEREIAEICAILRDENRLNPESKHQDKSA